MGNLIKILPNLTTKDSKIFKFFEQVNEIVGNLSFSTFKRHLDKTI